MLKTGVDRCEAEPWPLKRLTGSLCCMLMKRIMRIMRNLGEGGQGEEGEDRCGPVRGGALDP